MDLELTAVARSGVDLPDGQCSSQRAQNLLLQSGDNDHLVSRRRGRLGLDARFRDLAKDMQHART